MEEDQPIKIRSDLYLGRNIQANPDCLTTDISPKENNPKDDSENSNEPYNESSPNSENILTELPKERDLENDGANAENASRKTTAASKSPLLDPGGNYYSATGKDTPPSFPENLPSHTHIPSSEQTYQWSDSFPYSCSYQTRETINKFSEYYRSSSGVHGKINCNAGLDLSTKRPEHSPASSPLQSPKVLDPYKTFCNERDESKTFSDYGATLKSLYSPSLMFSHLPSYLFPWLFTPQFQNLVQCQNEMKTDAETPEDRESQPLDLSAKREAFEPLLTEDEMVSRVIEIKPSARGRKRADSNKKSYTDEDLHAALTAILVEKLGTRRAAQLYGIPRSTLRNKVHKLTMEKERNKKILEKREKLSTSSPDLNGYSKIQDHGSLLSEETAACDTLKTILKIRLNEKLEEISKNKKTYLTGGEKQEFLGSVMSYLMENLPKLTLNADNKETHSLPLSSLILYPQLGEFIHKVVEDKFDEEVLKANSNPQLRYLRNYHAFGEKPYNHLNVPVFPPAHIYNNNYDSKFYPAGITTPSQQFHQGESNIAFKDVLSHIINNKMTCNSNPSDNVISPPPSLISLPVQNFINHDMKRSSSLAGNSKVLQNICKKQPKSPTNLGGKGSRPKRGKYRNYDRNNLVKAVKAVQSGEMSVHRAGSHFGVPHSTLEYKVKERHLHRGKKKSSTNSNMNISPNSLMSPTGINSFTESSHLDIQESTLDGNSSEYTGNDDVSIIRVDQGPCKRFKRSADGDKQEGPPVPQFPTNSYPFWNNSSPTTTPFIGKPFSRDSTYSSTLISGPGERQKLFQNIGKESSDDENIDEKSQIGESVQKPLYDLPHRSAPEGEDSFQSCLLSTILKKKMENSLYRDPSTSPSTNDYSNDKSNLYGTSPMGTSFPQPNLLIFNSLLPSIMAARTSLAAALSSSARSDSNDDTDGAIPSSFFNDPAVPIAVEAGLQDGV